MIIFFLIIEYIILGFISYILLNKIPMQFEQKNKVVELKESDKKILLAIMSILWIIFLPKLYFDSIKHEKK